MCYVPLPGYILQLSFRLCLVLYHLLPMLCSLKSTTSSLLYRGYSCLFHLKGNLTLSSSLQEVGNLLLFPLEPTSPCMCLQRPILLLVHAPPIWHGCQSVIFSDNSSSYLFSLDVTSSYGWTSPRLPSPFPLPHSLLCQEFSVAPSFLPAETLFQGSFMCFLFN